MHHRTEGGVCRFSALSVAEHLPSGGIRFELQDDGRKQGDPACHGHADPETMSARGARRGVDHQAWLSNTPVESLGRNG
jgi:hypothetical protein